MHLILVFFIQLFRLNKFYIIPFKQLCQINLCVSYTISYLLVGSIIVCKDCYMLTLVFSIHATLLYEKVLEIRKVHTVNRVTEENYIIILVKILLFFIFLLPFCIAFLLMTTLYLIFPAFV